MNISSLTLTAAPVLHVFPPVYEGLGLPELSSYMEQRFSFTYTIGKIERTGYGSIRKIISDDTIHIVISEKLTGVGPKKLQKLKEILLGEAQNLFLAADISESNLQKVYHTHFRKTTN
ncbi:hypothetical protein JOC77_000844 [Peribacillus deserti]|uniref:RNA polymerase alpha subunit C-terminal domain-containing protein n=1 Tax=Peribacillus deserti TaxID=673318 RepID=A0ABS2QF38_9BACI|nr:hypothetical protein [Peribacillus deserti]MBM7691439.1 hypothetical protein [Peribacillus deserti]